MIGARSCSSGCDNVACYVHHYGQYSEITAACGLHKGETFFPKIFPSQHDTKHESCLTKGKHEQQGWCQITKWKRPCLCLLLLGSCLHNIWLLANLNQIIINRFYFVCQNKTKQSFEKQIKMYLKKCRMNLYKNIFI